jgi:hypothetical protein
MYQAVEHVLHQQLCAWMQQDATMQYGGSDLFTPSCTSALMFCIMSSIYDLFVIHILQQAAYPETEEIPVYRQILKLFTTHEIIGWPLPKSQDIEVYT